MKSDETGVIEFNDFLPYPHPELTALDVVTICMETLQDNTQDGIQVCFEFSTDRCRAALGGSLEKFKVYATNPVFGYLVHCRDYSIVNTGPVIAGTPTRGAMQTVLMDAGPESESRRFLWTLQQERRPPRQGCWIIHEVVYVKNAYALTL